MNDLENLDYDDLKSLEELKDLYEHSLDSEKILIEYLGEFNHSLESSEHPPFTIYRNNKEKTSYINTKNGWKVLVKDGKDGSVPKSWPSGGGLGQRDIQTLIDIARKNISTGISDASGYDITDNGDGTIGVPSLCIKLYQSPNFTGNLEEYHVTSATLSGLIDGSEQYVCVDCNFGNPFYYVENNKNNINESNISLVNIVWRQGNTIHSISRDCKGLGLANKIESYVLQTTPYSISVDGGLMLSESNIPNNRTVIITSAVVYSGIVITPVLPFNSSTDRLTLVYNENNVWKYSSATYYNNTQYDDGANLRTIPNNKYAVRWFYRTIGDVKECFYVLGKTYYNNISLAQQEFPRTDLPIVIKHHGYLVGRSIIQYNANSGFIENVAKISFDGVSFPNHNDLKGLQGGDSLGNYYHLSASTFGHLSGVSSDVQDQINYVSASINQNTIILSAQNSVANLPSSDDYGSVKYVMNIFSATNYVSSANTYFTSSTPINSGWGTSWKFVPQNKWVRLS